MFEATGNWVIVTPVGQFDASAAAMKKLYYAQGDQTIPLENLFEKFYTPNLLATLLQGGALPEPDVDVKTLAKPPTVKMFFDEARNLVVTNDVAKLTWKDELINIKVTAECTENAIDEIRLYLNGKLIKSSDRNLVVVDANNEQSLTQIAAIQTEVSDFERIVFF